LTPELRDLEWRVFTVNRPGLTRDVPAGYDCLMCVANSVTLIYGERDAILVDTFLTRDQNAELADAVAATAKNLTHIYTTHADGDHFFGIKLIQERFPNARAVATTSVVDRVSGQVSRNGCTAVGASSSETRYPTSRPSPTAMTQAANGSPDALAANTPRTEL
jgi:glyoxylase-like metal-dependent hydrolase (beta-lactamase superfamily II)